MTPPRLIRDIQQQPVSLQRVAAHQRDAGHASLLEAAGVIRAARRTVIVGMGASLNAAAPLENLLCAHGLQAMSIEAGELLHFRSEAYLDATFIVVSRSGESVEIVKLLTALQGRAPVIAVTNVPGSTLARAATVALDVHSLEDEMVAIQTHTGTLLTLHMLGMAAAGQLDEAGREVDALLSAFPAWVERSLAGERDWDSFLLADAPLYALGRGPSQGSASQAALLCGEIAKAPAIGMASATFRHGPVEVVDARFRGLIFAPQGRAHDMNIGLARDIHRFGGRVRIIGPATAQTQGLEWLHTPQCSEMLAPLLEIVPVQVAAARLAQLRGIALGSFRFAPQVATDETRI